MTGFLFLTINILFLWAAILLFVILILMLVRSSQRARAIRRLNGLFPPPQCFSQHPVWDGSPNEDDLDVQLREVGSYRDVCAGL